MWEVYTKGRRNKVAPPWPRRYFWPLYVQGVYLWWMPVPVCRCVWAWLSNCMPPCLLLRSVPGTSASESACVVPMLEPQTHAFSP